MSFPASLTTRVVKGRFVTHPDGVAATGFVRIVLDGYMQGPADDLFVAPFDRVFRLENGAFSTVLPATNDPDWTPSFYRVTVTTDATAHRDRFDSSRAETATIKSRLDVPYDSTDPIDLVDVLNVPPIVPGNAYVLLATKGQPNGIASLDSNGQVPADQLPTGSGGSIDWSDITDKPATFAPSAHIHPTSDVTGLDTSLAAKASSADLATGLSGKADTVHTHSTAQVTGLDTALAAKASTTDLSTGLAGKADSSALTSGLAGKANTTHTHTQADVSGLTTDLSNKADLVSGIIPTSQIPSISKIDFLGSVSTQGAMLALTGQGGDWCIRTDLGQTWVITGSDPTSLSSWTSMPLGTSPVQTVNGQVGTVVLGKTDIGLGNVDNTSDTGKPVSTAQQTALNLKAPLASPAFSGTVSGVTAAMVGLGSVNNTADTAKPVSTAQQSALDAKAPLASPGFTGTVTGVTAAMVGLGSVNNTADTAKPVSTAQQTALDAKAPLASPTFSGTVSGVTAAMVGLGNVTNTADTAKPVSTAQQTALDLKAPLASPAFTGTPTGITKTHVGLGSVDNTADTTKPVSTAQQTALDLKANLASPTLTGTPAAPTPTAGDNTTKIATTAYVTTAVAAGGGGAPAWSAITAKPDYVVDRNVPLRKWHAALANRHYAPAKIAVLGDSLSEGIGATAFGRGWVPMALGQLRNRFPANGVAGGQGFVASWDNPGYGGGAPSYTYPVGQNSGSFSATQGFSLKSNTLLATGDQMNYTFTGTSVHVWYIKQTTGGTFSVTIDGVVVQASVVTAGTSGTGVWTSAALAYGTHTILVTRIAGGGASSILFNGFRIFNGDENAGIQMFNGSQSGLLTSDFTTNATNGDKWALWLGVIQPNLVIIELGLNDWAANVSMVTVKTNLQSIITTIRAQTTTDPSIVIYAPTEANSGSYASTFAQLHQVWVDVVAADSKTCLFDVGTRIPAPTVDTSDAYYYDTLHPSDKGHAAIADRLASFLAPL